MRIGSGIPDIYTKTRPLQLRASWIQSLFAIAATGLALAQSSGIGREPPKLHGQTLNGKAITLPEAAVGSVTLLLLGTSKKSGEQTGPWKDHFVADFGSHPHVTYFVAAMLQSAPPIVRGMIRAGMRKKTPASALAHVLTSSSDEDAWKKYLDRKNDNLPAVLLLDRSGHLRWSFNGVFDADHYLALKMAVAAALNNQ
jgi:hypothetical protein